MAEAAAETGNNTPVGRNWYNMSTRRSAKHAAAASLPTPAPILTTAADNQVANTPPLWPHLSLATPDAQDEGHLDLGQVHEVLGDVDGDLVQEGGGDVEACRKVKQQQKHECYI
jgi:hypothetical protein